MTVGELAPPARRRRRVRLVVVALRTLLRVELGLRRHGIGVLCRDLGIEFAGFAVPDGSPSPLPVSVVEQWWAVETALRWWPVHRDRPCLRRALVLGHRLRWLGPTVCVRVESMTPFRAHAWLIVRGQHLDMGRTTERLAAVA